jgi:predicted DsbA family dithiol-disulfide isomerase
MGVTVTTLPYELHPEIPARGISLRDRWGARYGEADAMYRRIEQECEEAGLPFRRPEWVPNTRRALMTATAVRESCPGAFPALDRALFRAHFADGRSIGDPDVLDTLVAEAGCDPSAVRAAIDGGEPGRRVLESMMRADEVGVTGTPAWLLDGRLLVPGAQPRGLFERVVERLRQQQG